MMLEDGLKDNNSKKKHLKTSFKNILYVLYSRKLEILFFRKKTIFSKLLNKL